MGVSQPSRRSIVVSHPTGNANVSAVVSALEEAGLLTAFFTCIVWRPESLLSKLVPIGLRAMLERRARVQIPPELVRTRPARELIRNLLIKAGKKQMIADRNNPFSIDGVYRDLDAYVGRSLNGFPEIKAVYAYEDGAVHQFRQAHKAGVHCIYDLPIGYWKANRQIAAEEAELQPAWKGTLLALADSEAKCALKDEELALAHTVMVPSSFVKKTLALFPEDKKVVVNPFGVPVTIAPRRQLTDSNAPLKILYVGSLTQRKGISYLFDAVDRLGGSVSLTVIGRKVGHSDLLDSYCQKYRWLSSLPHSEILAEMRGHDVFVFPSLFEGLALVIGEAVSQGLPVIYTENSGGTDILRDGIDGYLVPTRDSEAIAERLLQLSTDRDLLLRMSDAALERAQELSWRHYQDRMLRAVREVLHL